MPQQANGIAAVAFAHFPEPSPFLRTFLLIECTGYAVLKRILAVQICNLGVVSRPIVTKF